MTIYLEEVKDLGVAWFKEDYKTIFLSVKLSFWSLMSHEAKSLQAATSLLDLSILLLGISLSMR